MHELSIAREIIAIVEREMVRQNLSRVSSVSLKLGALTALDPEALTFGFETGVQGTPLAGAMLNIERLPVRGECRTCGESFEVNEYVFLCPQCGSRDLEITQGEELAIDHIMAE